MKQEAQFSHSEFVFHDRRKRRKQKKERRVRSLLLLLQLEPLSPNFIGLFHFNFSFVSTFEYKIGVNEIVCLLLFVDHPHFFANPNFGGAQKISLSLRDTNDSDPIVISRRKRRQKCLEEIFRRGKKFLLSISFFLFLSHFAHFLPTSSIREKKKIWARFYPLIFERKRRSKKEADRMNGVLFLCQGY